MHAGVEKEEREKEEEGERKKEGRKELRKERREEGKAGWWEKMRQKSVSSSSRALPTFFQPGPLTGLILTSQASLTQGPPAYTFPVE